MKYEIKVTCDTVEELQATCALLAGVDGVCSVVDEPEKPKTEAKVDPKKTAAVKKKTTTAKVKPEPKQEEVKDEPEAEPESVSDEPVSEVVDYDTVGKAVLELFNTKGRAAVETILKKYKVKSARDLDPSQYEKVLKEVKAAI